MTFRPSPTRSGLISLSVAIVCGALVIFLINSLYQQSDLPSAFKLIVGLLLILVILGSAIYWTITAFRLQYYLSRNGLAIQWGLAQHLIPFEKIEAIIPGQNLPSSTFRGLNIAGLRLGRGESAEYGSLKFHTTATLADSLLVVTPHQSYVISPRSPDNFLKAWQVRQPLGPTQHWGTGLRRSWPLNMPLLADPITWWLGGLATLSCLALFGYLSLKFPELPSPLPIHFNAVGEPDRIADKAALLMLPAVGALGLGFNLLLGSLIYQQEKVATYLLWGSTLVLQLCLWVAVLHLTP